MFLIAAWDFTHRSAGLRALFRLCHHLNNAGYPSALIHHRPGRIITEFPPWNVFGYEGPVNDTIVVYPEVVSGNPYGGHRVVRWVLNDPGALGGDTRYADDELVFVYDPRKRGAVNRAVSRPIGPERVLWVSVVDPAVIHADPTIPRRFDCTYVGKGRAASERFPLPAAPNLHRLEDLTPTAAALGDTLRKTRTLYSYDHYSNVLREAALCGCEVRTLDADGQWHDPRRCDCPSNIIWDPNLEANYAAAFHDHRVVEPFIEQLAARWPLPAPRMD